MNPLLCILRRGQKRRCVLLGLLFGLSLAAAARAAELPEFTGFTRPGDKNDVLEGNRIRAVSSDPVLKKKSIGGSVYYTVLQLNGDKGDPWGTRVQGFVKNFQAGVDFAGRPSPELDTSATFLYLYQVVNDRKTLTPIKSASVKLIVKMEKITSWGYFSGMGFGTSKKGKKAEDVRVLPVSFSNRIAATKADQLYQENAPSIAATQLRLTPVFTRGIKPIMPGKDKTKPNGALQINWDPAVEPAVNPSHAMLLSKSDFDEQPSFRVVWTGDDTLNKDQMSTVFGFTSNLPPTIEPVRIRGQRVEVKANKIIPVVGKSDPSGAESILKADGNVPTPRPESPFDSPDESSFLPGLPDSEPSPQNLGGVPMGGGSSGGLGAPGVGGIGTAPPPSTGGGGGFGGGNGSGSSSQQSGQRQSSSRPNINIKINVQQEQNQTQSQSQYQSQSQNQSQEQSSAPTEVIPEPAAILLAGLGFPLLLLIQRRRRLRMTKRPIRGKIGP